MTVKKLIELLSTKDPDVKIKIAADELGNGISDIESIVEQYDYDDEYNRDSKIVYIIYPYE